MANHKAEVPQTQPAGRPASAAGTQEARGAAASGNRPQTAAQITAAAQQKLELYGGNRPPVARLLANQGPSDERDFRSEYQGAFYPEEERYIHNPAKKPAVTVPPQYANPSSHLAQNTPQRTSVEGVVLSQAPRVSLQTHLGGERFFSE